MNEMRKQTGMKPATRSPRTPFRTRLFAMLLLFALVPTLVVSLAWTALATRTTSLLSASSAWEQVAASGDRAFQTFDTTALTPGQRSAISTHQTELRESVQLARRFDYVISRFMRIVLASALALVILVALGASRVAGHLSRQLSRPLNELVGWTGLIRMGRPIPEHIERRGAPEFEVLRSGMKMMAEELEAGRRQALESERAEAFRESARRFAHELKNPLTPIRFAVHRLRREAAPELAETVSILAEETARLEAMARSFAQFGRLPDGPVAEVDIVEMVTQAARSVVVPAQMTLDLNCEPGLPLLTGFHEALSRAVSNIVLNAVEASQASNRSVIAVSVKREGDSVVIRVSDQGAGMPEATLGHIFEPYITTKPGGTGLGLAIVQQTVEAHRGSIAASSSPGEGTVITVTLPLYS